jgi:hypothetical protein
MDFISAIKTRLTPVLISRGFKVVEESSNLTTYGAGKVILTFAHDPRDRSNTFWIETGSGGPIEVDDRLRKDVFATQITLETLSIEKFIDNLIAFINEGHPIVNQDELSINTILEKLSLITKK